jgi:NAD(P)-dependent dehydrogenase (short-subunit alcohol dehydrogenase family)
MASYVVTGGGRGVGRAVVERLAGEHNTVAVLEFDAAALDWVAAHPAAGRILPVIGDAADPAVAEQAATVAQTAGPLAGWVNNAAVFRDAWLHEVPPGELLGLIARNLDPVVVGSAVAVRHSCPVARARSSTSRPTRRNARSGVRSPTPPRRRRSRA